MTKKKVPNRKNKHDFFLNPYDNEAFTKCPRCENKTKVRKFPLIIHVHPNHLISLNKTCKYCTNCDLIIAKKSEIEYELVICFENRNPDIIGNDYLVVGTIDRQLWQKGKKQPISPQKAIEQIYIFNDVLNFEIIPGHWDKEK